ncbi:glutaredoxin family protein [Virgibacillus necropolis]|uniref:glutaredoxin family protein n=1 Tax=Virgibacillus necropolis TaxID=163877 RepID=UPI0038512BB9
MTRHNVIIYTSDNSPDCEKLVGKMNKWGVDYIVKNVSNNSNYLKELQSRGVFGTPATFVDDEPILGIQESKLRYVLSLV